MRSDFSLDNMCFCLVFLIILSYTIINYSYEKRTTVYVRIFCFSPPRSSAIDRAESTICNLLDLLMMIGVFLLLFTTYFVVQYNDLV